MDQTITDLAAEFTDIPRVPALDTTMAVVHINYTSEFALAMDLFRGILQTQEKSERVLVVLWAILQLNPANYTVWKYRRDTIRAISADIQKELSLVAKLALRTPKNFQIWHHRRDLITLWGESPQPTPYPTDERDLCLQIHQDDEKNYHVWSHRKWFVERFKLFDGEVEMTDKFLADDVYNNSAWNYRYFALVARGGDLPDGVRENEILRAISLVWANPDNESPLSYARGLCNKDAKLLRLLYETLLKGYESDTENFGTIPVLWALQEVSQELSLLEDTKLFAQKLMDADPYRKSYWESVAK
eukprot:PhF_6_TR39804/c0_g1_i1/m.59193/K05955/FNTA; protein farnesyltransferase/geranylgeranyltransferase type-1 subunit alpha